MKITELGEIPEGWQLLQIKDISKVRRGASPRPIEDPRYFGNGRGWIRIADVTKSRKYLKKTKDYLSQLGESKSVPVNPRDLIMSIAASVGKPIIVKMNACIHDGFVLFSNLSKDIDVEFLYYLLTTFQDRFGNAGQHGTQKNLNTEIVSNTKFLKPPLDEQQKIASILSKVDELIQKTHQIIEQTQRLKKVLMLRLFTKGIGHTKFKNINFAINFLNYDVPFEWNVSKLKDIAYIHGRIGWKGLKSEEYVERGPLMLSVWSLIDDFPYGVDYSSGVKRLSEFRYNESPEIKLQNGDVLLAKDGDIGRTGYVSSLKEPTTVNSHVVVIRAKSSNREG
jgi:type I restriction enzyme S subunit